MQYRAGSDLEKALGNENLAGPLWLNTPLPNLWNKWQNQGVSWRAPLHQNTGRGIVLPCASSLLAKDWMLMEEGKWILLLGQCLGCWHWDFSLLCSREEVYCLHHKRRDSLILVNAFQPEIFADHTILVPHSVLFPTTSPLLSPQCNYLFSLISLQNPPITPNTVNTEDPTPNQMPGLHQSLQITILLLLNEWSSAVVSPWWDHVWAEAAPGVWSYW